jgi:flavin reductase (DIM6/NTAB) family NADH-FMN oxidoreductase RutF
LIFDPELMQARDFYRVMLSAIVPRPIAWVTTRSAAGIDNLAPFSFFNGVTSRPPTISISVGSRKWEEALQFKDTLRNIEETHEFVVHSATESLAELVNRSSEEFPPQVSEIEMLGLEPVPSDRVKPPRLKACPVALECVLDQVVYIGDPPLTGLVLGRIVLAHVEESVWDPESRSIDVTKLRPVARLGGQLWAPVREAFRQERPDWKAKGFQAE